MRVGCWGPWCPVWGRKSLGGAIGGVCEAEDQSCSSRKGDTPVEGQHVESAIGQYSSGCLILGCLFCMGKGWRLLQCKPCILLHRGGNCHIYVFTLVTFLILVFCRVRGVVY